MSFDLEKSLKAKIRQIAKEGKQDPLAIWQNLILERFLVRLSRSFYHDRFILKGGHLLSKYIPIGRETQDLDFFAKNIRNDLANLEETFNAIALVEIGDGFEFKEVAVRPLSHPHMSYLGAHITMRAFFGKIRFKVLIDLGFDDRVLEVKQDIPLLHNSKGPLFESCVQLHCYPQEFIFAEKLETIIYRGGANSRMKDFHDLHSMTIGRKNLDLKGLKEAISLVFSHRKTSLKVPVQFSAEDLLNLENYWKSYYHNLNHPALKQPLPATLEGLISVLNDWLNANILD